MEDYSLLEDALLKQESPEKIISLLSTSFVPDEVIRDVYIYALNTSDRELEDKILQVFPENIVMDTSFAEQLWIYAHFYDRPDLLAAAEEYLGSSLPWGRLLTVALYENIESIIHETLLEGRFSLGDLVNSLVAARRLDNQEMINYLESLVGPDLSLLVEKGYVMGFPEDSDLSFRHLFKS